METKMTGLQKLALKAATRAYEECETHAKARANKKKFYPVLVANFGKEKAWEIICDLSAKNHHHYKGATRKAK